MDTPQPRNGVPATRTTRTLPGRIAPIVTVLLTLVGALGVRPATAAAGEELFRFGTQEIGVVVGPGFAIPVGGTDSDDLRDVRYAFVAPRWGIQITDPHGRSWYRGNLEFLVDGQLMIQVEPRPGVGGGPLAMLRYNFLSATSVVPFFECGAGIMGTSFDLKDRPDGYDFSYQIGFGFHYLVAPTLAVTASTHFHHVSNAYLKSENLGINSIQVEFGISKFFR